MNENDTEDASAWLVACRPAARGPDDDKPVAVLVTDRRCERALSAPSNASKFEPQLGILLERECSRCIRAFLHADTLGCVLQLHRTCTWQGPTEHLSMVVVT
jgi:hypothetical protein